MKKRSARSRATEENPTQPATGGPARTYSDAEIEETLSKTHGLIAPAARILGCSRGTLNDRIAARPDYWRPRIAQFSEAILDFAENVLAEGVMAGNSEDAKYLLKTKGKSRGYSERTELTGPDGGDLVLTLRPPSRSADE